MSKNSLRQRKFTLWFKDKFNTVPSSPEARYSPDGENLTTLTAFWWRAKSQTQSSFIAPSFWGRMCHICRKVYKFSNLIHFQKNQTISHNWVWLTKTWESVPPVESLWKFSVSFFTWISILRTGSLLCQDISGIMHFIVKIKLFNRQIKYYYESPTSMRNRHKNHIIRSTFEKKSWMLLDQLITKLNPSIFNTKSFVAQNAS